MRLPPELGLPKDVVARLDRCMYGTFDAGSIWEACFTDALVSTGVVQGVASPSVFRHDQWGVQVVVHGDDLTALGHDAGLDKYGAAMASASEIKLKGRLGVEPQDLKEVRVLNRVVRIVGSGLLYEPDPRHVELLIKAMGLEDGKHRVTPGQKPKYEDVQDSTREDPPGPDTSYADLVAAVKFHRSQNAQVSCGATTFVEDAPGHYVPDTCSGDRPYVLQGRNACGRGPLFIHRVV